MRSHGQGIMVVVILGIVFLFLMFTGIIIQAVTYVP